MGNPIRVLIVDDSALMRHRLSAIIGGAPGCEVAGLARNGEECLAQLAALRPDVVTLDVEMPGLDGLGTLRRIMSDHPAPVVMVSSLTEAGARTTLDALALGAVEYVAKPSTVSPDKTQSFGQELIAKIVAAAQARVGQQGQRTRRALPVASLAPAYSPRAARRSDGPALVAIGSSTGGPQALDTLLSGLSADLPAAFLIVQHMPPVFTRSLAARLERRSGLRVREVQEGDRPAAGQVIVAQGGWHMVLGADGCLHLDGGPLVHGVRPAVDCTFASLARYWTGRCLAVVLTGMGVDGTDGVRALHALGSDVIAQDEESSVVWGMPRSVVEAGLATSVLPLEEIASAITQWITADKMAVAAPVR